jgi:UDP-N-acetylmuramyl tripeptide synthase
MVWIRAVTALAFDVAVMTNLSRDHLDYHGTMEAYGDAKAKLFAWNDLKCRVVNLDDDFGRQLAPKNGVAVDQLQPRRLQRLSVLPRSAIR